MLKLSLLITFVVGALQLHLFKNFFWDLVLILKPKLTFVFIQGLLQDTERKHVVYDIFLQFSIESSRISWGLGWRIYI